MCPTSLLFSFTFKLTSDIDLPLVVEPKQEGGREGGSFQSPGNRLNCGNKFYKRKSRATYFMKLCFTPHLLICVTEKEMKMTLPLPAVSWLQVIETCF